MSEEIVGGEVKLGEYQEKKKTTYLLPIWIDITSNRPKAVMKYLNAELEKFFEEQTETVIDQCDYINIQWSVNEHLSLE